MKYFTAKKGLQKYLGNIGRNLGVGEMSSGNAPKFVYDTIMSGVVDSSLAGIIGGAVGSTAVGAALVSGSAMTDTARQVKMQGGSDERALALGTVAGALEYVTEKMGYDRLAEMITKGGRGGLRAVLSNMMSEYAEEASSEVGNYLAEWCADTLEDVDLSTFRQTRQAYIDQGMSADEATSRTWIDFLLQVNEAGMGGALGGAIMGGGSQIIGRAFNAAARYEYNRAISQAAKEGDPAAKAYQFNRDRTQNQDAYGQAFDAVWNGAADGLTLEQIERAAPDILDTLTPAQKQGIYDAARNEAEAQTNTSDGTAKRPEIKITQIDEDGDTRTGTVDGTQSENVQTEEIQPAREHTQNAVDSNRAETVSERVSAENRAEIEHYAAEQAKTGEGGVKRSYAAQKLSRDQRKQIRILDELGKHYGVEIDVVDTIDGGKANAVYEGSNKIRVALDATDQAYVQVGTHELVHYLKRMDEQGYRVVEKLVTDELSKAEGFNLEDTILERRAEYAAQDVMIDEDAAMEEIVAEAIPSIWGDERAVRAFVSQNRSLAQKVRDFIVDFVDRLRQYAADYAFDQDRMEALALQAREQDAAGTLEEIARTFDLALESAKSRREAAQTRADMNGQTRTEAAQTEAVQSDAAHEQTEPAKPGKPVQKQRGSRQKQMKAAQKRTVNKQTDAAQAVEAQNNEAAQTVKTPATETRSESEADAQKRIEFERSRAWNAVQALQTSLLHREHDAERELRYARSRVEGTEKLIADQEAFIKELGHSSPRLDEDLREFRGRLPSLQAKLERLTADTAAELERARAELAEAREDAATWGLTPEQIRQAALAGVDDYRELMQGGGESLRLETARRAEAAQNEIRSQIEQATSGQTEAAQRVELTDGVKYSIRSFDEQIQDVIDGKFPKDDHVYVMETPEVLQSIGLKKLPMLMTQKHAYTTTMAEGKYRSTDVNYHALGLETMKQLPNAIADPLMVIKSHNYDGRITVITELTDSKGRGIIAPVIVNGRGVWENVEIPSNVIASVFGKKNIANTLKNAFKSEEVLYIDKKRSDLIAQTLGVQFPDTLNEDRSSADIIADLTRAVKGENSENQQKISKSGEENANQAQNEGEIERRKFALKKSVEQIEDLVAVHNTTADKISKTLDLGGFPMPSIAITKTGIAHSDFGEITLVFGRETVDPRADKRNKVYSADAWTPTVPRTEYEADAKAEKRIRSRLNQIKSLIPADYRGYLSQYANLDDALNRYDGQAGLVQHAMTDSSMRAAYVADKGGDVTMEKKSVTEGGVSDEMADKYRRTLALFDNDVDKIYPSSETSGRSSSSSRIGGSWSQSTRSRLGVQRDAISSKPF